MIKFKNLFLICFAFHLSHSVFSDDGNHDQGELHPMGEPRTNLSPAAIKEIENRMAALIEKLNSFHAEYSDPEIIPRARDRKDFDEDFDKLKAFILNDPNGMQAYINLLKNGGPGLVPILFKKLSTNECEQEIRVSFKGLDVAVTPKQNVALRELCQIFSPTFRKYLDSRKNWDLLDNKTTHRIVRI